MKPAIFYFVVTILFLTACGSPDEGEYKYKGKTVFRYNEMGTITSLDPAGANKLENIWIVNQIFNGLVQMNDQLDVIPCISKNWEISGDGKEYTFHLRNDVFFQDSPFFNGGKGRKVTASDFVYSFTRLSEMNEEQSAKYLLEFLDRSEEKGGKGVTAPDDTTFKIFLAEPFSPFLEILTMQFFSVVPHEVAEHYGEEEFGRHPVGTGPFILKKWTDEKLVLLKNDNYFEKEGDDKLPYLDAVSVSFIKDKETAFTNFLQGDFEMISGMETINKDAVLTKSGDLKDEYKGKMILQKCPFLKTDYLGFFIDDKKRNKKDHPLMIKEVRQAINYAIDRVKIVTYLRNNIGAPAGAGFVPKGLPSFNKNKVNGYPYDPERSKALLKKAGFPGGAGLPEITLNIVPQFLEISEAIRGQLAQVGIQARISVNPSSTHNEMVESGQYDFFRKSWVADYADAQNFFSIFYSGNFTPNGPNYFHFVNKGFDTLYEEALRTTSTKERYEIYYKMDNIIMEEAVVVPLFYDDVIRLVQNNVQGLTTNPMNLLNLKAVRMK